MAAAPGSGTFGERCRGPRRARGSPSLTARVQGGGDRVHRPALPRCVGTDVTRRLGIARGSYTQGDARGSDGSAVWAAGVHIRGRWIGEHGRHCVTTVRGRRSGGQSGGQRSRRPVGDRPAGGGRLTDTVGRTSDACARMGGPDPAGRPSNRTLSPGLGRSESADRLHQCHEATIDGRHQTAHRSAARRIRAEYQCNNLSHPNLYVVAICTGAWHEQNGGDSAHASVRMTPEAAGYSTRYHTHGVEEASDYRSTLDEKRLVLERTPYE